MTATNAANKNGARVLLVSTNRERQPYPVVPNGLASVASALDGAGHQVEFLDLCFAKDPVGRAREATRSFRPDFIGVLFYPTGLRKGASNRRGFHGDAAAFRVIKRGSRTGSPFI